MERVDAIKFRHTHNIVQVLVIYICKSAITCSVWLEDIGTCVTASPSTIIHHIALVEAIDCVVYNAVGHLAAESRDDRLHAKLTHALQHITAKLLLTGVPPVGVTVHLYIGCIHCTAPPLKVIHRKPCNEARAGNICIDIILAHTQFAKQLACHHIQTNQVQRSVDTVQSHPVNLLLPAFPSPESH